jgi:uncharacterized membrane protein YhiD involved in acid resistance
VEVSAARAAAFERIAPQGLLREVIAAARGKIALTFDDDLTCHGKVALTHDIIDIAIRLASALAAGSLLGFERSFHGRPAGIRTHALVCLASALLMLVPAYQATWLGIPLDSSSPSRMAQGIMTGIGFLGAGVIFQQGFFTVRGLTTAASVCLTAALGIFFGIGFFYAAVIGTLAALGVLAALRWLELPAWKLRRLVYEDGECLCSLSKQPNLSGALDDTADASHEVLPLAILSAFVEARRRTSAMRETSLQTVPQVRRTSGYAICCDNFT